MSSRHDPALAQVSMHLSQLLPSLVDRLAPNEQLPPGGLADTLKGMS
jgi:uncharacterized protein YidB (DUF937 family)